MPKSKKNTRISKVNYPKDTSRAKKSCGMPMTKKYIDIESRFSLNYS